MSMSLELRPCDFQTAAQFVGEHHRHNKPPVGHKFSIACYDGDRLCGVCMVGRPIGRYLDDGLTLDAAPTIIPAESITAEEEKNDEQGSV